MTRPIILVDQDGPLADFDRAFHQACNLHDWTIDCTPETQTHRFATGHITDHAHRRAARALVETPGWFACLPATPGAEEGLARLAEVADVWIVTKPLEANPTCRDDKAGWVRARFGREWERRLIIAADKSMVRGDVLLDDAPHPDWYARASWAPVIFPTPWNGAGTKWAGQLRWSWTDPIDELLAMNGTGGW